MTFMDHGGLIVAVRDYNQRASRFLKYSTDGGNHWYEFEFSLSPAVVLGAFTDYEEKSSYVWLVIFCIFQLNDVYNLYSLFGIEDHTFTWVVWNVNISAVFPRHCIDSDYYTWSPLDEVDYEAAVGALRFTVKLPCKIQNSKRVCLLGYDVSIERRMNNITCLNGPTFHPEKFKTNCSCSIQDYEWFGI